MLSVFLYYLISFKHQLSRAWRYYYTHFIDQRPRKHQRPGKLYLFTQVFQVVTGITKAWNLVKPVTVPQCVPCHPGCQCVLVTQPPCFQLFFLPSLPWFILNAVSLCWLSAFPTTLQFLGNKTDLSPSYPSWIRSYTWRTLKDLHTSAKSYWPPLCHAKKTIIRETVNTCFLYYRRCHVTPDHHPFS